MKPTKTLITCLMAAALYVSFLSACKQMNEKTDLTVNIDSTFIGQELDKVMKNLQVDSTILVPFDEPPMILRGVEGMLPDSTKLTLYVERTLGNSYDKIKNKKIIGLALTDTKGNVKYFEKADTSEYVLTIKQGKYEKGSYGKIDNQTFYVVPIILTNNTDGTLKYLSMSCSWNEFYCVDNDKMDIYWETCTRNFPIMLTLLPHKSADREIKLVIKQTTGTSKLKFRIGIHLLKVKNNEKDMDDVYNEYKKSESTRQNPKNIIWSNTIEM